MNQDSKDGMTHKMREFISIIEQYINEGVERLLVNNRPVNVYYNPSTIMIADYISKLPYNTVRGLELNGQYWIWDSEAAVHFQVAAALGLDDPADIIIAYREPDSELGHTGYYEVIYSSVKTHAPPPDNFMAVISKLPSKVILDYGRGWKVIRESYRPQ